MSTTPAIPLTNKISSLLAKSIKKDLRAAGHGTVNHNQILTSIAKALGYESANAMRAMNELGEDVRPTIDPKKARYFRTTYLVDVLAADEPMTTHDLEAIAYETDQGACVGRVQVARVRPLSPGEMRQALEEAGSDSSFFHDLDDDFDGGDFEAVPQEAPTITPEVVDDEDLLPHPYLAKVTYTDNSGARTPRPSLHLFSSKFDSDIKAALKLADLIEPKGQQWQRTVDFTQLANIRDKVAAVEIRQALNPGTMKLLHETLQQKLTATLEKAEGRLKARHGENSSFLIERFGAPLGVIRADLQCLCAWAGKDTDILSMLRLLHGEIDSFLEDEETIWKDDVAMARRRGITALRGKNGGGWDIAGTGLHYSGSERDEAVALVLAMKEQKLEDPRKLTPWLVTVNRYSQTHWERMSEDNSYHPEPDDRQIYPLAAASRDDAQVIAEQLADLAPDWQMKVEPVVHALPTGMKPHDQLTGLDSESFRAEIDEALSEEAVAFLEWILRNEDFQAVRPATLWSAYIQLLLITERKLQALDPRLKELKPNRQRLLAEIEAHLALGRDGSSPRDIVDWK